MLMTCVIGLIGRTYQLKCIYPKKQKHVASFLLLFYLHFQHFEKKKHEPHSLNISEIIDFERHGYLNE